MVHQVEMDFAMQSPGQAVGPKLPQVVIGADSSLAPLPEARPPRQVVINEVNLRHRICDKRFFDRLAVIETSNYPAFFKPADLPYPVPAGARLGAFSGLARIRRNKNFQRAHPFLMPDVLG